MHRQLPPPTAIQTRSAPCISSDIALQMRPYPLAAVTFDEEFQQLYPFAPHRIGKPHTAVLDTHAADVPQRHLLVGLSARHPATVEFISKRPCDGRLAACSRSRRCFGQRIALQLIEAQTDTVLRKLLRRLLRSGLTVAKNETRRRNPSENPIPFHPIVVFAKITFLEEN